MHRQLLFGFSLALLVGAAGGGMPAPAVESWAFTPPDDSFDPGALLDLRGLNEKIAGESGFVSRSPDGNGFVRGDGVPIRFWAVFDEPEHAHAPLSAGELAKHARFLAKRGVNLVRVFEDITSDKQLDAIDDRARDQLWRTVAAMKQEGIYVLFTPIWMGGNRTKPELGFLDSHNGKWGDILYQRPLQEAFRSWMKQTLTVPNPYTGIPLAQDPALAIIMIDSEDSLLFWSSQGIRGAAKQELRRQFFAFLSSKYGTLNGAPRAWQDAMPPATQDAPDDFSHGEAALYIIWELTQRRGGAGEAQRCADQLEFLATTEHGWYQRIADYLHHDLGCRQLINAGNWRTADNVTMLDAERWSYTPGEVMAINRYYTGIHQGPNSGWAICNGDRFTDESVLLKPRSLPISLKQVEGYPMLVTESNWVGPLSYKSEAPMLIAAYQSLTGVGPYIWFALGEPAWATQALNSANGYLPSQGKWICATPMLMGQWPAAALLYRSGYLSQGAPVVREQRALADLWARAVPIIAEDEGYDPNRDQGLIAKDSSIRCGVDPLAYLVGPVRVTYGGDPGKSTVMDLGSAIDDHAKTVRSDSGELAWDYGRGFCTMDAPKAQGATGFFNRIGGSTRLKDIDITCRNDYATVMAVSMDGEPLATSKRILVQVGTRELASGWQAKPVKMKDAGSMVDGQEVVSFGKWPWRIEDADVGLVVRNTHVTRATSLDANGMATAEIPLAHAADGVSFRFPPDALYLVLH